MFGVQPLTVWHCRTQHSTDSRSACAGEKEEGGASTVEGEEGRGKSAQTHAHTHAGCSALSRLALSPGVGCRVPHAGLALPAFSLGRRRCKRTLNRDEAGQGGTGRARAGAGVARKETRGVGGVEWSGKMEKGGKSKK